MSYRTLFYGLKQNHPHNVALTHVFIFVLRRVLFALVIVCMAAESLQVMFGIFMLMATCLAMSGLLLLEAQWEDNLLNH